MNDNEIPTSIKKLTPLQKVEIKLKYAHFFYETESFVDYFMKDDKPNEFSVPTRQHMVIDKVPGFQSDLFKKLDKIWQTKRLAIASPRSFLKSTGASGGTRLAH